MRSSKKCKIRPYARLLTMLGEQLIKNERIALIELIKNAYDADADWVKITFENFKEDFSKTTNSKIIIEDNGWGMTDEVIMGHWLNPATPDKLNKKKEKPRTPKGRFVQGEKGIGRFAMLKLGQKINVITRPQNGLKEYNIDYDFSMYDSDFLTESGEEKELFLDDLNVSVTEVEPKYFIKRKIVLGARRENAPLKGTRIEISNIKGEWSEKKVRDVFDDTIKLCSGFITQENKRANPNDFEMLFYHDEKQQSFREDYLEKLKFLINERSVIRIENGVFDQKSESFSFSLNGSPIKIELIDPVITGLKIFNKEFGDAAEKLKTRKLECGTFRFTFFIFDFSSKAEARFQLDKEDKGIIKDHRIYLYRDGVRVYPYGEPDDDWLQIDIYRGTVSAGGILSNDQVVGRIDITHRENPKLKDKTNREGLIEDGYALSDFISLIKTFLSYIRHHPYKQYQNSIEDRKVQTVYKTKRVKMGFDELRDVAGNDARLNKIIDKTEKDYNAEKDFLERRFQTAEDLAGVGLSVETASHDINSMMERAVSNLDALIKDLLSDSDIDKQVVLEKLQSLHGWIGSIEALLTNVQLLFKSAKQRRKNIRVLDILKKVEQIYQNQLKKAKIVLEINNIGSPLVAKTTDAVLLQLFINLIDNSFYWLNQIDSKDKKIMVYLDGNKQQMIFSDTGPGIRTDDAPCIFEAFYSGKGEEGRGLGLYIAKQLLERNEYTIKLAEIKSEKKLNGANFVVDFVAGED